MPLGFQIYPDLGLLFIRSHGKTTQSERIRTVLAFLRDPAYEQCGDAFFDLTASETTPRIGELRDLIAILKQHRPARGPRRLAVVVSKPITFAVASVFEKLMRLRGLPVHVKVFIDSDHAWKWLRPDMPRFEPR
jgi:hypothetical protein